MKRALIIVALLVVMCAVVSLFVLLSSTKKTIPAAVIPVASQSPVTPTIAITQIVSLYPATDSLTQFVNPSLPIIWKKQKTATQIYSGKTIPGKEQSGEITYKNPSLHELANTNYLQTNGWKEDEQIAADGPTGSEWGFNKTVDRKKQIVIFSYTNTSFSPPPAQTTCPCTFSVSVFLSDPL